MSKGNAALLEEMGVPVGDILSEFESLVKAHTVTTGEGGKKLEKPIAPSKTEKLALLRKVVTPGQLAGVEAWVENQLAGMI